MYRDYKEGKNTAYKDFVEKTIVSSKKEAIKDEVEIPSNEAEYCNIGRRHSICSLSSMKPASPSSSKRSNTSSNLYCYDEYSTPSPDTGEEGEASDVCDDDMIEDAVEC